MRVLLYTGKGGVGKTTMAAASAVHAARAGVKTLVVSTDAAHSLGDAFGVRIATAGPVEIEPSLFAEQVDARSQLDSTWGVVQQSLADSLSSLGVDAWSLSELPGVEDVLALLALREHVRDGPWDLVVVDCAPSAQTLRLLALPEVLTRYVDRLRPGQLLAARSIGMALGRSTGLPKLSADVVGAANRLREELAGAIAVLRAPATSVRLVLTPEAVVIAEARRTRTALALHGFAVDAVVANRVVPAGGDDAWRHAWVTSQTARLAEAEAAFAPLPMLRAPYLPHEPLGPDALSALAGEVFGGVDNLLTFTDHDGWAVERAGDGYDVLVDLPLARAADVDLARCGDELVLTLGSWRRVLLLPSALRRCVVRGARMREGRLRVHFEPDPALWPRS